ncbi:MAG: tyrosine-type recombinase/integrase [Rhodocyclaceae bacterium]|nr:tyrosine-type recombinase/integrase [Rhodocyclaceae bacterium]
MATKQSLGPINRLSNREVQCAGDGDLFDGGGLLLRVRDGRAGWVFRYTAPSGKRREMGLGPCERHSAQAVGASVTAARRSAAAARAMLVAIPPVDPITARDQSRDEARAAEATRKVEAQRERATLARVARLYHERFIEPKRNAKASREWINSLETHVPREVWNCPIERVERAALLDFLRDIQDRMFDTASRVRQRLSEVYDDAIERGLVQDNPVAALRDKLRRVRITKRSEPHPSLPYPEMPAFMSRLRTHPGIAARCMEFVILTAARTGEAIGATWDEINMDTRTWTIPGKRMKMHEPHIVPLSEPAVAILRAVAQARSPWVFPGVFDPTKPLSNMGMLSLLKRMDRRDITVHGFRSTFSTWANETAAARPDVIEACLAHREGDRIRAAYNRAHFNAERRALLDAWARFAATAETTPNNVIDMATARAVA